jgi:hypothetical protein
VPVRRQRLAVDAEDASGSRVQRSVGNKAVDGVAAFETGINADQRLRPEAIAGVKLLDLLLDVRSADQRERAGKPLVIVHQRLIEIENVHSLGP